MSSAFYEMHMDMEVQEHFDIMDTRDILAPYDKYDAESDSEMFMGEENKENEEISGNLPPSHPRPSKRTSCQPSSTSTKYRLGPRRKLTDKDLDFVIYRDETAHEVPPFRKEYYGSNLPALGEIHNGVKFEYALNHQIRRDHVNLIEEALEAGDEDMADALWNIAQEEPRSLERLAAAYIWDVDCDLLDIWLWVQDKGYDRKWSLRQKQRFVDFLEWMKPLVETAAAMSQSNPEEAQHLDEWNDKLIQGQFDSLGLSNLLIEKENIAQVTFIPYGEDENVLHRADFTELEQGYIDAKWRGPGRWAPGEEAVPPLETDCSDEESEEESEEEYDEEEEDEEDDGDDDDDDYECYEEEMAFEGDDLIAF